MSVWSYIVISFPEELFVILITLAFAGNKENLNFRDKSNLIKLFLTTILLVINSVIFNHVIQSLTFKFFIHAIVYFIIIFLVYRFRLFYGLVGYFLSIALIIVSESIFFSTILKVLDYPLEYIQSHISLLFLASLPTRIAQILIFIIICISRKINLRIRKIELKDWFRIFAYFIMILLSLYSLEDIVRGKETDYVRLVLLITNVLFLTIFSAWLLLDFFKIKETSSIDSSVHEVELQHLKHLIQEGRNDHAIKLIEATLKNKGY